MNWLHRVIARCLYRSGGSVSEPDGGQQTQEPLPERSVLGRLSQSYEMRGLLGQGGLGLAYLVCLRDSGLPYVLKTFRPIYLADRLSRERFHQIARLWISMDRHPYLVRAFYLEQMRDRLYAGLEYFPPGDGGINSLAGYLERRKASLAQVLRWGIQICLALEHAYACGLRCHLDLKPGNVLLGADGSARLTDPGLAAVVGWARAARGITIGLDGDSVGLSVQTLEGAGFGTPTHMSPEQFTDARGCDERSDIYSLGVMLFQLSTGGVLPFSVPPPQFAAQDALARYWWDMFRCHKSNPVPDLDSPLRPVVARCLEKEPRARYARVADLRLDLSELLRGQCGQAVTPPGAEEAIGWEWVNRGAGLHHLDRYQEALKCYDRSLEVWPGLAYAWSQRSLTQRRLGQNQEAVNSCDRALEIDSADPRLWYRKGQALWGLQKPEEAEACYERALAQDPLFAGAWNDLGVCLEGLGRPQEALAAFGRALELEPAVAEGWSNLGNNLLRLERLEEALSCYVRALEMDTRSPAAWFNRAAVEEKLCLAPEAASSYRKFISMPCHQYAEQMAYAQARLKAMDAEETSPS